MGCCPNSDTDDLHQFRSGLGLRITARTRDSIGECETLLRSRHIAGARVVPDYRIYKLTHGGHIADPPIVITQPTDDDAIEQTKQLLDGHDLQLWQGGRLIITLEPKDKK